MQSHAPAENKMGVMPIPKLILNMSLPMILSMMVQALYNVVDSYFVARFEQDALTAVSLAFPAQNLMIGVATGTAVGVNALLSRALGEKKPDLANRIAENGVFLALVGYLLFLIFGLFGVRTFYAAQTDVTKIVGYGVDYANLGKETGSMIAQILLDGADPADTPVLTFDNGTATVNTETCAAIGFDFETIKAAFAPFCTQVKEIKTAESFE